MFSQVFELAVNRNEIFRLDDAHYHFQLLLAGVAGDMDFVHLLIYDIRAELHQLVNDTADGLFVAGNRSCGNYNIIVRVNFDLTVIRERHAGQGAHRFALAARGDDNELIGGIAVYHIDIDNYPLGDVEIAELRRDAHDIFEASADERDLAPETCRNIHYLLHAVDIGRECCNYYAVVARLAEEGLERFADLSLALGEAGTLGVGGVGHKAEDSLLPYLGESAEIHHTAVDRRCVDFEVARVDDSAALAADSESECVGYGMVDMDSLNGKAAEGYHIAGIDDIE